MRDIALYENIPSIENNFTVKFRFFRTDSSLVAHWHEHIELLYFLRGNCEVIAGGEHCAVEAGDLIVVNSTEVHSFVSRDMMEYFCILMYPAFFSDIEPESHLIRHHVKGDPVVKECMEGIANEAERGEMGADMMLKSYAYRLMAHLTRNHSAQPLTERERESSGVRLKRLEIVIKYISENYTEKITTRMLADMCYISEEHFCRFFKAAVGKSAGEYINEYRVEKAAVLLSNTDSSIAEIAERVGFDDMNYFSRVFKAYKGMSPMKYRKANK